VLLKTKSGYQKAASCLNNEFSRSRSRTQCILKVTIRHCNTQKTPAPLWKLIFSLSPRTSARVPLWSLALLCRLLGLAPRRRPSLFSHTI